MRVAGIIALVVSALTVGMVASTSPIRAQRAASPTTVAEVRSIPLQDQDGRPFSLSQMVGTVTVLNFVYTGCGSQCPLQTSQLANVQAALPDDVRDRVQFISISVDPEHDFPAALRQFAVDRGADLRRWRFVTGQPADVETVAVFFGARPPPDRGLDPVVNHNTAISLFDDRAQGAMRYAGQPVDETRLLADLTYLVTHAPETAENTR